MDPSGERACGAFCPHEPRWGVADNYYNPTYEPLEDGSAYLEAALAESDARNRQQMAIAADFTPVVGDIKGFIEVGVGQDIITGEDLGALRLLGLIGLSEVRNVRHADDVFDFAQTIDSPLRNAFDLKKVTDCVDDAISWTSGARNQVWSHLSAGAAGGPWQVIDEVPGAIQQQFHRQACTIACAVTLLAEHGVNVSQETLAQLARTAKDSGTIIQFLEPALNQVDKARIWAAGEFDHPLGTDGLFRTLNNTGSWIANLGNGLGGGRGHSVIVDGFDEVSGLVSIRDPWDATTYKMSYDEFMLWWNDMVNQAVYSVPSP